MELTKLSASSAQVFVDCERRYWAENAQDERPAQESGDPALLGTTCHEVLEWIVTEKILIYKKPGYTKAITDYYNKMYDSLFSHEGRRAEGLAMVLAWVKRQDFSEREVLMTEVKLNFGVKTSIGTIPFNYIWDRADRLPGADDGFDIEVIDYKSWMKPMTPAELKEKIQTRCYALAAQFAYPEANRIWVTLDQLRYDTVSAVFKKADNLETWKWLKALCEKIIASDGTKETVNQDCRYCVYRHQCKTYQTHVSIGGPLSITDPIAAADRRHELANMKKGIEVLIADLDRVILAHMQEEGVNEFSTDQVKVSMSAYGKRSIDPVKAREILGDHVMATNATITIGAIDELMKGDEITDAVKSKLKQAIRKGFGEPGVKTTTLNQFAP